MPTSLVSGGSLSILNLRLALVGDGAVAAVIGFMAAGCLRILLHYNGNSEFQREIDPSLAGWALAEEVMTAKAPPVFGAPTQRTSSVVDTTTTED